MSVQQRRNYDPDFKRNAVELTEEAGRTISNIFEAFLNVDEDEGRFVLERHNYLLPLVLNIQLVLTSCSIKHADPPKQDSHQDPKV